MSRFRQCLPIQANSPLDQRFEQLCQMEFNDFKYDSQLSMSQNNKRALNLMEVSLKFVNGPYKIALPSMKTSTFSQKATLTRSIAAGKVQKVYGGFATERLCKKGDCSRCRHLEKPLVPSSTSGVSLAKTRFASCLIARRNTATLR